MFQNLKNRIKNKLSDTVFGNASSGIKYLYGKNSRIFYVQMIIAYIVSAIITGYFVLLIMNLGGSGYLVNLRNMFAAWLSKGILISLIVFLILEMMFFRAVLLFRTNFKKDEDRNYDVSNEGTYGTNSTMAEEEMKRTFHLGPIEEVKDPIFGKNPYNTNEVVGQKHPLRKINRNVLMISGPSGGKSATYVIPLLFQIMRKGQSAIVSDPKSELFKITSELAKMLGYEVRILNLNPMFLENSDPCNFMMYVGDDIDKAQVMSNAIIANTTGGEDMLDFWSEGALNLLQAIILRISVGNDFKPEEKNLPQIFTYITHHTQEDMEADFASLSEAHPASAPFRIFADGEEKVKKQVLQGLRIKLKLFNSQKLRTILSATEGNIDILNPGRTRCLYFVGSNDQDSSMSSIVSLFYTLLYQELVRYADTRMDQELPVTVHMVLDEYANMGTIPDFEKKLSTVRSRNIITHIIIQDINQLKLKHPFDAWRTVMNDIDYFLMLKTNDPETMSWWSEMSGEQTINVKNRRYDRSKMDVLGIHAQESITEGQGTRQVFTAGEVRSLKDDEVLLMVSQRDMIKLKTFFWATDHPYGRYVKENQDKMYVLPAQHYPFWRLIRDGIVDKDFDYDHEPSFVLEIPPDEKLMIDEDYDPDRILKIAKRAKAGSLGQKIVKMNGEIVSDVRTRLIRRTHEKRPAFIGKVEEKISGANGKNVPEERVKSADGSGQGKPQPELRVVRPKADGGTRGPEKIPGREPGGAGTSPRDKGLAKKTAGSDRKKPNLLPVPETVKQVKDPRAATVPVDHVQRGSRKTAARAETSETVAEEMLEGILEEQREHGEDQEASREAGAASAFSFFDEMDSLDEFLNSH